MSALETFIEIAEGTVDVLNVVRDRSDRIRTREGTPPEATPSRYGRGKDPSRKSPDEAPDPTVSDPLRAASREEPTVEIVIDAATSNETWIVSRGSDRVECFSAQVAEKVRNALR
jgi:hypothetical protein